MNSLSSRTPTKKVWEKFKEVDGNCKPRMIPPMERGGRIITTPDEIADTFAVHCANISRDPQKKESGKTEKGEEGRRTAIQ